MGLGEVRKNGILKVERESEERGLNGSDRILGGALLVFLDVVLFSSSVWGCSVTEQNEKFVLFVRKTEGERDPHNDAVSCF